MSKSVFLHNILGILFCSNTLGLTTIFINYKCEGNFVIPSEQLDSYIFPFCWVLPGIQLTRRRPGSWGRREEVYTWRQRIKRTCISYSLEINFIKSTCLGFNNLSLLPQLGDIYSINLDAYLLQSGAYCL